MNDYVKLALDLLGENKTAKDWKSVFYPIGARSMALTQGVTVLELVDHSYRKFLGLLPAVLRKLDIEVTDTLYDVESGESLKISINAQSCSLCHAYYRAYTKGKCTICPIFQSRNQVRCDMPTDDEEHSPWESWAFDKNPIPMLETLQSARKYVIMHPGLYEGSQYKGGIDLA